MNLEKKAKIVIASVLKPANDVRMFEKIGESLAKRTDLQVSIWGYSCELPSHPTIRFHCWKPFRRLTFGRFGVQLQFWKKLTNTRPDVLIVSTHELLFTATVYNCIFGGKLVYDVRENYLKNLIHQKNYPLPIRYLVGGMIRFIERLVAFRISAYFVAEKGYLEDMPFLKKKALLLQNKSLPIETNRPTNTFKIVITGTLSAYSQCRESIGLYLKLKDLFPNAHLRVIGHAPSATYRESLLKDFGAIADLRISDQPIPHQEILAEISSAHLAIIGYTTNAITAGKSPTKMYEYVMAKLPFIIRRNTPWSEEARALGGAIEVDFDEPDLAEISHYFGQITSESFDTDQANWQSQESRLLETISELLNK